MKYKLLKKIDGIHWEVGEIKEAESGEVICDGKYYVNPLDLHNLLLNGTIEKVEENTRWRASREENYWFIDECFEPFRQIEVMHNKDTELYNIGNYFQTREQAQAAADKIKQLLKESHE